MDLELRGKTALVTGASKGIGLAIARSLAREGCHVWLVARTRSELDKVADEIRRDFKVEAIAVAADLSQRAGIEMVVEACRSVDILINSAGAIPRGGQGEIDEDRWRRAWDLKVFGTINLTREIYGPMCARGSGVILNIVGVAGLRPDAHYIAGSTANAALIMFSRSLGGESVRHGVRVVAVNPGPVETEKTLNDTKALARERFGDETRWRELNARFPMQRAATTNEVSDMVAFLASDRAAYISGVSIDIDGGLLSDASVGVKRS